MKSLSSGPSINFAPHEVLQDRTRAGKAYDTYSLYRKRLTHYELTAVIMEDNMSLSINFSGCCFVYKTTLKSTTDSSTFIVTADNIFTDYQWIQTAED